MPTVQPSRPGDEQDPSAGNDFQKLQVLHLQVMQLLSTVCCTFQGCTSVAMYTGHSESHMLIVVYDPVQMCWQACAS